MIRIRRARPPVELHPRYRPADETNTANIDRLSDANVTDVNRSSNHRIQSLRWTTAITNAVYPHVTIGGAFTIDVHLTAYA